MTALILSIIILGVMTKAYITYRANQNVTAGGLSIYPTFMQLWPTYMMIIAGAVTVLLNACVVAWRVRGTMKDLEREEMYNKVWDYVLHGITVSVLINFRREALMKDMERAQYGWHLRRRFVSVRISDRLRTRMCFGVMYVVRRRSRSMQSFRRW